MKILLLEDDDNRIYTLKQLLKEHELILFKDVAPAIQYIEDYGMSDVMFLDHDLGGEIFVALDNKNTGSYFAKYIKDNKLTCAQIIIHSLNPAGAENMYSLLKEQADDVRIIPYPILIEGLKDATNRGYTRDI